MAHVYGLVSSLLLVSGARALNTCPGFPGYCSESFPGQTCNVVCSVGRNNVPLCQDDGTWTDIPRCVEHEPGVAEQIPGTCPGISGYCSQGFLHQKCKFDCTTGPNIDSVCSSDGTWSPYPTCEGDLRETRDGCDGCPGPLGRARNRTAEALSGTRQNSRVPKTGSFSTNRQQVPSFAGNTKFGKINTNQVGSSDQDANRFFVGGDGTIQERPSQRQPTFAQRQEAAERQQDERRQAEAQRQQAQRQQAVERQKAEAERQQEVQRQQALERQQAARRQQAAQQQTFRQPQQQQQPQMQTFRQPQQQQQTFRQPQQQTFRQPQQQPQPQQQFQQGLNTFQPNSPSNQPLTGSLFDQIKNGINAGHRLRAQQDKQQQPQQQNQQQQQQQQQPSRRPLPVSNFLPEIDEALLKQQQQLELQQQQQQLEQRQQQQQQFQQRQQQDQQQQQFGVFETVNLGGPQVQQPRSIQRSSGSGPSPQQQATNPDFFGEFPTVDLQG